MLLSLFLHLASGTFVVPEAHAGLHQFGLAVGDAICLGCYGRDRQKARARADEEVARMRAQEAASLREKTTNDLKASLTEIDNNLSFVEMLRLRMPTIGIWLDTISDHAVESQTLWHRIKNNLTALTHSSEHTELSLSLITKLLTSRPLNDPANKFKAWDENMGELIALAHDNNRTTETLVNDLIKHATPDQLADFIDAVAKLRTSMTMMTAEIESQMESLKSRRQALVDQLKEMGI